MNSHKATIAIYQPAIHPGGTARVTSLLIELWSRMGYEVVLVSEDSSQQDCFYIFPGTKRYTLPSIENDELRRKRLQDIVINERISLMVFNKNPIIQDISTIKLLSVPVIGYFHERMTVDVKDAQGDLYRSFDAVIVLSYGEEQLCRRAGICSRFIPNPLDSRLLKVSRCSHNQDAIWVGRLFPEEKRPLEALDIMQILTRSLPHAHLNMFGTTNSIYYDKSFAQDIQARKLCSCVNWHGFCPDIYSKYPCSSVYIHTSTRESFSMTLLESRAFGLPCVMYHIEDLILVNNDHCGTVTIPQGNCRKFAEELHLLMTDFEYWRYLSDQSYNSFRDYAQINISECWNDLLNEFS